MKKLMRLTAMVLLGVFLVLTLAGCSGGRQDTGIYAYDDFVEGRYIRTDGRVYLKLYQVDKKTAQILLYEANETQAFTQNYEPPKDSLFAEGQLLASTNNVKEGYLKKSYELPCNHGPIIFFMDEKEKKIHVDDYTGNFSVDLTGDYVWQPYYVDVTTTFEEKVKEIRERVIEIPGVCIPPEPDQIREITVKVTDPDTPYYIIENYDRIEYEELTKIAQCFYARFVGKATITKAEIEDRKKFRQYHLYERLPFTDSFACTYAEDEDLMIDARERLFLAQKGSLVSDVELLLYQDTQNRECLTGLYVENGRTVGRDVTTSNMQTQVQYHFASIDWQTVDTSSCYYRVNPENDTITLYSTAYPVNSQDGGIAWKVTYEITFAFLKDETILAEGYVDAYGMGTEHLQYHICASAIEFQTNTYTENEWQLTCQNIQIIEEGVIPGEEREYTIYEVIPGKPGWCLPGTTIVEREENDGIVEEEHHHMEETTWPQDEDEKENWWDTDEEGDGTTDENSWEQQEEHQGDGGNNQQTKNFLYYGGFISNATSEQGYTASLTLEEDGSCTLYTTIPYNGAVLVLEGTYTFYYEDEDYGGDQWVSAYITMNFPDAPQRKYQKAEIIYDGMLDVIYFRTPGFGEMGGDEFFSGRFERVWGNGIDL